MKFNVFDKEITVKRDAVIAFAVFTAVLLGMIIYAVTGRGGDIIIYGDGKTDCFSDGSANSGQHSGLKPPTGAGGEADTNNNYISGEGNNSEENSNGGDNKTDEIKVYVVGCVKNPGIVTLKKGQLVDDAIKAAGGLTDDADIYNINLVYSLNENMMLRIKSKSEIVEEENNEKGTRDSEHEEGKGIEIITDEGTAVNISGKNGVGNSAKININTASVSELDTLPGIGIATANEIIAYREANGKFKTIEDIMKVPRIKENRFNNIKDFITVN